MRRPTDLPAPALDGYDAAQIRFAAMAWPMRAAEELRSGLIFRALAQAARAAAMPDPWPTRFAMAVRDEARHARLCATVGARLGAPEPRYDVRPVRARLAGLHEPLMRTASLLLVEVAMGETISTYLFRAGRRGAVEPLTRAALGAILSDEVRHQRLGWDALTALWPLLGDPLRAAVQREAARGFAAAEQQNARPAMLWLQRRQRFDPAYAALGVLNPEARVEAFYFAVERFVVPRLTRLGLDGPLAWKNRYVASTT
jgi:P-aminobenzoate N-oxygenase AurF